jgi:hypothetical protein
VARYCAETRIAKLSRITVLWLLATQHQARRSQAYNGIYMFTRYRVPATRRVWLAVEQKHRSCVLRSPFLKGDLESLCANRSPIPRVGRCELHASKRLVLLS